jgi:hypothetical protein
MMNYYDKWQALRSVQPGLLWWVLGTFTYLVYEG